MVIILGSLESGLSDCFERHAGSSDAYDISFPDWHSMQMPIFEGHFGSPFAESFELTMMSRMGVGTQSYFCTDDEWRGKVFKCALTQMRMPSTDNIQDLILPADDDRVKAWSPGWGHMISFEPESEHLAKLRAEVEELKATRTRTYKKV